MIIVHHKKIETTEHVPKSVSVPGPVKDTLAQLADTAVQMQSDNNLITLAPRAETEGRTIGTGGFAPGVRHDTKILYAWWQASDIMRTITSTIVRECFRNGGKLKEKWQYICDNCGYEYEGVSITEPPVECEKCGSTNIRHPDWSQRKLAAKLLNLDSVNHAGETLDRIARIVAWHISITDIAYVIIDHVYYYDKDGYVAGWAARTDGIWPALPTNTYPVKDSRGVYGLDDMGRGYWICADVTHRTNPVVTAKQPKCPTCKRYMVLAAGMSETNFSVNNQGYVYYTKQEFMECGSDAGPDRLIPYSKWWTARDLLVLLLALNGKYAERMSQTFSTASILELKSGNVKATLKAIANMEKYRKLFRNTPPMYIHGLDSPSDSFKVHNFDGDLKDLNPEQVRLAAREALHALFGIRPIQARSEEKSTTQQDSAETAKTIMSFQNHMMSRFYNQLFNRFGITNFVYKLNPSEKVEEFRNIQKWIQEAGYMDIMRKMGFGIELGDDGFKISHMPIHEPMDTPNKVTPKANEINKPDGTPDEPVPSDEGGVQDGGSGSGPLTSMDGRHGADKR